MDRSMISCDFQGIHKGGAYLYVLFYENMHFFTKEAGRDKVSPPAS